MSKQKTQIYKVVINHEEQYSIYPVDRATPPGWKDLGSVGSQQQVLEYIEEVWTDMRPRTIRQHIEALQKRLGSKL